MRPQAKPIRSYRALHPFQTIFFHRTMRGVSLSPRASVNTSASRLPGIYGVDAYLEVLLFESAWHMASSIFMLTRLLSVCVVQILSSTRYPNVVSSIDLQSCLSCGIYKVIFLRNCRMEDLKHSSADSSSLVALPIIPLQRVLCFPKR